MQIINADVLVIGGGLAGCMAAIKASEHNLNVVIVEKAGFMRSGAAGAGIDDLWSYVPKEMTLTVEQMVKENTARGAGLADQELAYSFYNETYDRLLDLQKFGLKIFDKNGDLLRPLGYGMHSEPNRVYLVNGVDLKPLLAREVLRRGVKVIDRTMITSMLVGEDGWAGGTGFNIRNGEFCVFSARAGVLSTGPATRLFKTTTGVAGSSWVTPSCTGDGMAMALRAGSELTNMEFPMTCIGPKNFVAGSMNCYPRINLVNSQGEPIKFQKRHEDALTDSLSREIEEGRGPIYMDATDMSEKEIEFIYEALSNEGRCEVVLDFMRKEGIDLRTHKVEWDVYERAIVGGFGGVVIDGDCSTKIPGLYSAGDTQGSFQTSIACGAITLGWRAGDKAAHYASKSDFKAIDNATAVAERERVFEPMNRDEGIEWQELQCALQNLMSSVAEVKADSTLSASLERLEEMKAVAPGRMRAKDPHGLMRVMETLNLMDVGEAVLKASIARTESRWFHFRAEHPYQDDENWSRWVIVRKAENGMMEISTKLRNFPFGKE